jgi:hypothetical protein
LKRLVYGIILALAAAMPCLSMVRIAVFIGNNIGLSDEKPLHYATRDAEQVQAVLAELGGIDKDGSRLLLDTDVGKVEAVLQDTRAKILSFHRQRQQVELLLYFSGHGSDDALHLNGEKLPMSRIRAYFKDVEADLKILIADACFSGSLIEAKGAALSEAVPIRYRDELDVNGSAILTSSSAGELSQESRELKGSLFTHYLLSAIRGAGDADRDGKVSLWEAYIYTQANLRRRMAAPGSAAQNPGFDLDVRGSENLVLTRMDLGQSLLTLKGVPQGRYRIMESVGASQIAEVNIATDDAVVLALPKAPYLIYQSQGRKGLAGYVDLRKAKSRELNAKDFSDIPVGELSAKGYLTRPFLPPQGSPIRAALHPRYYPAFPGRTGGALALAAGMQGIYRSMGTLLEIAYLPRSVGRAGGEELSQTGIGGGGELRYFRNLGRAGNAYLGPRLEIWQLEQTINRSRNNQARLLGSFAMAGLEKRVAYRLSMGLGMGAGCFWSYDQAGELRRDAAFPLTFSLRYDL